MHTCDACTLLACTREAPDRKPANCPMHDRKLMDRAFAEYSKEENRAFYIASCVTESKGYCEWPRLKEVVEFCRLMQYEKLGMAFCSGLRREAAIVGTVLRKHGFEVVSVICKTGGIPKEKAGLAKEEKIRPDAFEAMCNPVAQAKFLNEQKTRFNIVLGLCVGHDSLFYKYADAMTTTLITKDRVLAHNPAGAVYCYESYYKNKI